ncbi:hypothetical protein MKX01_003289 [Papaver californicum]|nr:hypothetical protein MKX01_003289 [Papaver californicum]
MAKQLPNAIEQTQIFQIYSSLQNTQNQLTSFLSNFNSSLQQQPQLENSVSSAIGGGGGGGDADDEAEPMQVGDDDDDDEEDDSEFIIDKVEERMKNCVIHSNKRRKRNLSSPSSIQGFDQRIYYNDICNSDNTINNGVVLVQGFEDEFDPQATRLRSLELIYQFHA